MGQGAYWLTVIEKEIQLENEFPAYPGSPVALRARDKPGFAGSISPYVSSAMPADSGKSAASTTSTWTRRILALQHRPRPSLPEMGAVADPRLGHSSSSNATERPDLYATYADPQIARLEVP